MTQTEGDWKRLGELLIAARVAQGFTRRAGWVRHLGLSHDRTILDIENAKRRNFDPSTLAFIEHAYGWRPGSIRAVLGGGEPVLAPGRQALGDTTVTETNSQGTLESRGVPVGPGSDPGEYVPLTDGATKPGMDEDEVLQLIATSRRLADELEKRMRGDGS